MKCKLLKASYNQISTNKVFDTKSTNKIYCLNNCLYAPANNQNKSFRIKSTNKTFHKTFISYNHFKGSKQAFNYKSYKSIKLVRFCRVARLKRSKRGTNKIFRLKIYRWGLVEIILLISSFGWSEIIIKGMVEKA